MSKFQYLLKKNSPLILSVLGSGGVILTGVLSAKAAIKAEKILKEVEKEKGEELTTIEKIRYGYKPFIFVFISGIATIGCTIGANHLNTKRQANIISAYMLLNDRFNSYRDNIKELCSEQTDMIASQEVIKALYDPKEIGDLDNTEETIFFEYQSMRFFKASMNHVLQAESRFLNIFHERGYGAINEYLECLGIPPIQCGYQLGWWDYESNDPYNVKELAFEYEKIHVRNADNKEVECWVITSTMPPTFDYIL